MPQYIDTAKEIIELVPKPEQVDVDNLEAAISKDAPRFSFFAYDHNHDGEQFDSLGIPPSILLSFSLRVRWNHTYSHFAVFIYTCPNGSKPKERMLYAACRASVIDFAESELNLTFA